MNINSSLLIWAYQKTCQNTIVHGYYQNRVGFQAQLESRSSRIHSPALCPPPSNILHHPIHFPLHLFNSPKPFPLLIFLPPLAMSPLLFPPFSPSTPYLFIILFLLLVPPLSFSLFFSSFLFLSLSFLRLFSFFLSLSLSFSLFPAPKGQWLGYGGGEERREEAG